MKLNPLRHLNRKIKVSIFCNCRLLRQSLIIQINNERGMKVLSTVDDDSSLIESALCDFPDVVVLCLLDGEGEMINLVGELRNAVPETKVVVLAAPKSMLDQTQAIRLGVAGIVSTDLDSHVLMRAIWQVAEGDVWFNQKLLSNLLADKYGSSQNKTKKCGFFRNDELTSREMEVVAMIGQGLNNRDIAAQMCISEATVQRHLSTIYSKLQIEDRLNLAIYAYRKKLLVPKTFVPQAAKSSQMFV